MFEGGGLIVKKIVICISSLFIALISLTTFNYIYSDIRYENYKKEVALKLEALEKRPPLQKTPDVLYQIADMYFTLGYE